MKRTSFPNKNSLFQSMVLPEDKGIMVVWIALCLCLMQGKANKGEAFQKCWAMSLRLGLLVSKRHPLLAFPYTYEAFEVNNEPIEREHVY